jgi:hypothetical protein
MSVQRYTWDRTADRTSALYQDLIAEYAVCAEPRSIAR